jgi:DNA replication licensing factor MCM3
LFIILDQIDPQHDRDISQHVLRMHTYRRPGEEDGTPVEDLYDKMYEVDVENEEETPIYEKMNGIVSGRGGRRKDLFSLVFLKKYIQYAKARVKPTLSKEAMELMVTYYSQLRNPSEADLGMKHQTLPITARTLETMIRLSTAHAKVRLSSIVEQVRHRLFRTKHIRRQLVDIL